MIKKNILKQILTNKEFKIIISCFFITSILTFIIYTYYNLILSDKIFEGVFINDIHVGNMTKDEAYSRLHKEYHAPITNKSILIKLPTYTDEIYYSKLDVDYNLKEAVNSAYSFGRDGSITDNFLSFYQSKKNSKNIKIKFKFNAEYLQNLIESIYSNTYKELAEHQIHYSNDLAWIKTGHQGLKFDKSNLYDTVLSYIAKYKIGTLEVALSITNPKELDLQELYDNITVEAVNSSADVVENEVVIIPHTKGRTIDKKLLESIFNQLIGTSDTTRILPITFIEPTIKTEDINSKIFRDTLATYSTWFSTNTESNRNRGININLASQKINNHILGVNEVFSFNKVVGERSDEKGYKVAHAYVDGKVIDSIGGGICQVSTTLYNSVLYSDLEIVERTNHMFTIGYAPLGQDAAVFYDITDFKFKNNTNWPLKLECSIKNNNTLYFSLIGTNETPTKKVTIKNEEVNKTTFKTEYIKDNTMFKGQTKVIEKGYNGYVINTFKTVTLDDIIIKTEKIHQSIYNPLNKKVKIGTKKIPRNTSPVNTNNSEDTANDIIQSPKIDSSNEQIFEHLPPPELYLKKTKPSI